MVGTREKTVHGGHLDEQVGGWEGVWIQPAFASSAAEIVFPLSSVALQTLPASPLIQVTSYHFPSMLLKLFSLL